MSNAEQVWWRPGGRSPFALDPTKPRLPQIAAMAGLGLLIFGGPALGLVTINDYSFLIADRTIYIGGIAGIASKSEMKSIKRYKDHDEYDEWEFIYDPRKDPGPGRTMPPGMGQNQLPQTGTQDPTGKQSLGGGGANPQTPAPTSPGPTSPPTP